MKIKTLFFGITTDLVGSANVEVEVEPNTSIQNFKAILQNEFSGLQNIKSYAIALNEAYAEDTDVLKYGDVVAVIPPVSGG